MLDDVKNYFANFDGAANVCRTIALWITVTLLIAFVITKVYIAVLGKRSQKYAGADFASATRIVNGAWIISALFVAACFIVAFSTCYFVDVAHGKDALVPILFYPLLVLALTIVASAATLFFKPYKIVKIVCAAVCGAALIAALACMIAYYASGDAGDALSNIGLYVSAVVVTAAIVALAFFADRGKRPFDTKTITFAAICVALSFALSYVRIFKMPMGGSITFASMLPLMLFAFMFGSRRGILVGLVYGVLQAIQDPWIIHPAQFALDYAVAFAAIGLTGCIRDFGLFKNNMRAQFALGACIACLCRFICQYFAGVH
ncbi:MAG: energy-coupled thiamine transporter ThiT, partial [Clostridiales bacterium]|nr:energy-coupled thiamine transporter ThiT [Clostridiales bacterium]